MRPVGHDGELDDGPEPTAEECARSRDVVWVLMLAATDRAVVLACVNAVRARHPGLRMMGAHIVPAGGVWSSTSPSACAPVSAPASGLDPPVADVM